MKVNNEKPSLNNSKVFCLFATILVILGCKKSENQGLEDAFISAIENTACGDSIIIDELTPFKWDKFYLIEPEYRDENIERIIGFRLPCGSVPLRHRRYLFIDVKNKDGEYFDLPFNHGYIFNCIDFDFLTPENLILKPVKMKPESKVRYYLNPKGCPDEIWYTVDCK
jgi:hypothetical protein